MTAPTRPLTERVLARLGRPRLLWMLAWGMLSFAAYEVSFRVFQVPTYPGRMAAVSSAYVNLLALWAIAKVTADLEAIRPLVQRLTGGPAGTNLWLFQAAEGVAGPVAMGVMLTILWNMVDFVRYLGPVTAILIPIMFAAWLPAETALWFFGALLVGLHRLGRMSLRLTPFEEDRSLGLRPLGSVAFTSFVVLTAAVLPLLATQWRDPRGAVTNLLFFLGFVALFFASLHGLHRQMVKAKAAILEQTHHLYVEAFRPIRAQWSLESAAEQSARLTAAEAIERRAATIQEWPLDEGLLARLAAIVTSVVGVILARLILSRFGL
ncbi:MAG TPA: hypothetical protein VFU40_07385 [Gemmatimonadales bacterium]|nr:hypothetical protein [Gemmatimonadales bacterium]